MIANCAAQRPPDPQIYISEEVGNWRDHGLSGFALHPNFLSNGYVYLLYVVDRHHLLYFGIQNYDSGQDEYFAATLGRLTRYQAIQSDDFTSVDMNSRLIQIGESINVGFPIIHQSHGIGSLVFGTDGTLLVSYGDGASYSLVETGDAAGTYYEQALSDGIITPKENVGSYRSQLIDSLRNHSFIK